MEHQWPKDENDRPRTQDRPHNQPRTAVEQYADEVMAFAQSLAKSKRLDLGHLIVLTRINNAPEGELDATSAGYGTDDPREVLADVLYHAAMMASALGLKLDVFGVKRE